MVKLEVLLFGGCVNSPHGPYGLSSTSEQSLREIADSQRQESAPAGTVWPAFEFYGGDGAFPLVATMQDVEHSSSCRCRIMDCTPLGATPEVAAEPA